MKFKIHRGTQEIGGSCVEIWTDSTRIVVDFGMPLVNPDRTQFKLLEIKHKSVRELVAAGILPDIQNLYDGIQQTTLLISHAHQDHYGLISFLHKDCKIYLGEATQKIIELTNIFTNQDWIISNSQHFSSGIPFAVGDFVITPYLMDHSAFDAYAFLIQANGKSIFYSGDFRTHGRKSKIIDWLSHNLEQEVDYLLLEGTTIGRGKQRFQTETDIENELVKAFTECKGINLITTSGQNIDRLVSIYRACKRTKKILAVDFYIANVLKTVSDYGKIPHPSTKYPEIKVFYPNRLARMICSKGQEKLLYRFKNYKITKDQIGQQYEKIVMTVRPSMSGDLEHINNLADGNFIYSMWGGYRKEKKTSEFINFLIGKGMNEKHLHTSGHADRETLLRMVEITKPKYIVPIHTFEGDEYKNIFTETHVLRVTDGEVVTIYP